jgi:hypothetical protein
MNIPVISFQIASVVLAYIDFTVCSKNNPCENYVP